jgi:hypothetical protein
LRSSLRIGASSDRARPLSAIRRSPCADGLTSQSSSPTPVRVSCGYYLVDCSSKERAIEVGALAPEAAFTGIEVREIVYELDAELCDRAQDLFTSPVALMLICTLRSARLAEPAQKSSRCASAGSNTTAQSR